MYPFVPFLAEDKPLTHVVECSILEQVVAAHEFWQKFDSLRSHSILTAGLLLFSSRGMEVDFASSFVFYFFCDVACAETVFGFPQIGLRRYSQVPKLFLLHA
jgi:hypothetical protein